MIEKIPHVRKIDVGKTYTEYKFHIINVLLELKS